MSYNKNNIFILPEHEEQKQFITWFRWQYPQYAKNLFAIPNGGHRNILVARKLKDEGVTRGVADLFLMLARSSWHGLFIEMKPIKGGQQSMYQKEFQKACEDAGYKYFLAKGCRSAQECIRNYLTTGE